MLWRQKTFRTAGSALFAGRMPPQPQEFPRLARRKIEVQKLPAREGAVYALELKHANWGSATVLCLRGMPTPPEDLIDLAASLTPAERDLFKQAQSTVSVTLDAGHGDLLHDRKALLFFLDSLLDDDPDSIGAIDHTSTLFWSKSALRDELSHRADLDVEQLFCIHAIVNERDEVSWAHTHGLGEIGAYDIDVLRPGQWINSQNCSELFRAMAFNSLEGQASPGVGKLVLAVPGGTISCVAAAEFDKRGAREDVALRDSPDDHTERRIVLCDPQSWTSRLFRTRPRPSAFLSTFTEDAGMIMFTDAATQLMSERARGTWSYLRKIADEVREFDCEVILKLAYETTRGGREHMWFRAHELHVDSVEATLEVDPFDIPSMHRGDRGRHDIERLTDWMVPTPAGMITPRSTRALRLLREHREEILQAMKTASQRGGSVDDGTIPLA